jgi:SH3-like domain-containing protein
MMSRHTQRTRPAAGPALALCLALVMLSPDPAPAQSGPPAAVAAEAVARAEAATGLDAAATDQSPGDDRRGPVTNLPLPRYVSLKSAEGNVRRGPSLSHRIDWVYRHRALPLQITAEFGHWRRVVDRDGAGGWVHYSLLSGVRTVLVEEDMAALRAQPSDNAATVARAEAGVVARLGKCLPEWCRIIAGGERGWIRKTAIWGVDPDEVRD